MNAALCASLAVAACLSMQTSALELTPLEQLLTESLAWDQFSGLVNTGDAFVSPSSHILFRSGKGIVKEFSEDPKKAEKTFSEAPAVIYTEIDEISDGGKTFSVQRPKASLSMKLDQKASMAELSRSSLPGRRYAFYCRFDKYNPGHIAFSKCEPIDQFMSESRTKMFTQINDYLHGRPSKDPEMPHFAMLAYMGVVSAKLLPKHSICRQIAQTEDWSFADIRLCSRDVRDIWNSGREPEKLNRVLDSVEAKFKRNGVDVKLLQQAFVAQD